MIERVSLNVAWNAILRTHRWWQFFSMAFWSSRVVQIPVRVRSSMEWGQVSLLLLFVSCCFIYCCTHVLHNGNRSLESYLYGNTGWYNWGVKFYILPTRSICWCLWSLVGWWILGDWWGTRIPNLRTGTTKSCRCNGFVRFLQLCDEVWWRLFYHQKMLREGWEV